MSYINWNSSAQQIFFLFSLFRLVWIHTHLFYTLWYNLILHYLFCYSNCSIFGHSELFQWVYAPLWHTLIILCVSVTKHFLTFWYYKMLQVHLVFPCHRLRISHFSSLFWSLLLGNGITNQDLSSRCAHCYWGIITSRTSQLTDKKMSVYTYF